MFFGTGYITSAHSQQRVNWYIQSITGTTKTTLATMGAYSNCFNGLNVSSYDKIRFLFSTNYTSTGSVYGLYGVKSA